MRKGVQKVLQLYEYNRPQINQYFLLILPGCGNNFSHTHSSAKCKKRCTRNFSLDFDEGLSYAAGLTVLHSPRGAQLFLFSVFCSNLSSQLRFFCTGFGLYRFFSFLSSLKLIYHIIISMLYIITSFPNCYTAIILDPAHCC